MVIIDTSVWVDYLNRRKNPQTVWLDSQLERQRLALTDLILCEVLQGIRDEEQAKWTQQALQKFEVLLMGGVGLAVAAAQNYRLLRARGRTVRKTIDCWIATFCLMHHHELLHNDRDFDAFEKELSLHVVHP
jgi:predicted nucleic acid-binding protein